MISERTKAGMAARKAADPTVKWGSKHILRDYPNHMAHLQGLYNAGEFTLDPRPTKKWPSAVVSKGMTAAALLAEVNAVRAKGVKAFKSPETIRRWLREGAPGLVQ